MTTIQKTINVPPDHHVQLDLDLPGEVPEGMVDVLMILSPASTPQRHTRLSSLAGRLTNSPNFSRDPVSLQRNMRDDWE